MKTAPAAQPYDLRQLEVSLAEKGLIKRGAKLDLVAYQPAFARRKEQGRWHYRVDVQHQTVCHLIVGTQLTQLHVRAAGFFKACPKLACQPLAFWESPGEFSHLCLEHFSGQSLDAAVQSGKCTDRQWLEYVRATQALLALTAQPSDKASLEREVQELIDDVSAFPGFTRADTMLLRELVQPRLIEGRLSEKLTRQWSNGDFVGRNLLINAQGDVRLIDYEYAAPTHFGQTDWLRLAQFSNLPKSLTISSIKEFQQSRQPWLEVHLWLSHLSHLRGISSSPETDLHVARSISLFFRAIRNSSDQTVSTGQHSYLIDALSGYERQLESLVQQRTTWAESLDAALMRARTAHSEKAKLAEERTAWAQKLNAELKITREENKQLQSRLTEVIDPTKVKLAEPPALPVVTGTRKLLLHFHIFKNAGSTLDAALEKNLGDAWMSVEGNDADHHMDWRKALKFIKSHPGARALSSHTLRYPVPTRTAGVKFLPLLLLRHPIDRLASIYYFERGHVVDSHTETSRIARKGSLADFIQFVMMKRPELGCDTQTSLIARSGTYRSIPRKKDLDAARLAIKALPVPGVVEKMDQYLMMLETEFSSLLPNLDLACPDENRNAERAPSLLTRLRKIRAQLPLPLWKEFRQRNRLDLELWRFAHRLAKARLSQLPESEHRLGDFLRRKALAKDAAAESAKLMQKAKRAGSSKAAVGPTARNSIGDPQAYALLQEAHTERLIWAKSLEKALRSTQANFAKLSKEHAERTAWAKALDADLKKTRILLAEQTKLVEERSIWAKTLDVDLKKARASLTQQTKLVEERSSWGKLLDAELQKARSVFAQQTKLAEERSVWAKSLDAELKKARTALGIQTKLVEERSAWAKSLDADLQKARTALAQQTKLVEERSAWGKSLDVELQKARSAFAQQTKLAEERSVWAKTLDLDLKKARTALSEQAKLIEERSIWAKSLDTELRKARTVLGEQAKLVEERSIWAKSLDDDLSKARTALAQQTKLVEERSAWGTSLEWELHKTQANFEKLSKEHAERSVWAKSLDAELQKSRTLFTQQTKLVEERTAWAKSLEQELQKTQVNFDRLSKEHGERALWAKSLDTELQAARTALVQQTKLVEERSAWAKSLEADLQNARTAFSQQNKLVEERSAWGKSLELELIKAQANFARLSKEHTERSTWAKSLDAELDQARMALAQQAKLVEERSIWAQSLDAELQEARAGQVRLSKVIEERSAWAKSLEQELRTVQANFDQLTQDYTARSAWAKSLEDEISQSRESYERLQGEYAERTAWALALDAELRQIRSSVAEQITLIDSRTAWAHSLEDELRTAQTNFDKLTKDFTEQSSKTKGLAAEINQMREDFTRLQSAYDERTAWALAMDAELRQMHRSFAEQATLIDSRTAWAKSLEDELRNAQRNFAQLTQDYEERSAWARSLDADLTQTREAYRRLDAEYAERTAWALSMNAELQKLSEAYQSQTQIMTHLSEERDSLRTIVGDLSQLKAKLESELAATRRELDRYESRLICRLAARRGPAK